MGWQDLLNRFQQNVQGSNDLMSTVNKQALDRYIMNQNPELSGPKLPDTTKEEQQFDNALPGSMIGSAKMPNLTQGEISAAQAANQTLTSGAALPAVQRTQQALSRAADFADRARQQAFQATQDKFSKLKQMMSR